MGKIRKMSKNLDLENFDLEKISKNLENLDVENHDLENFEKSSKISIFKIVTLKKFSKCWKF